MMIPERPALERRVLAALEGSAGAGARIPVVLGGCGTGRTSLLLRLRDLIGRPSAQYIDVERIATTPERFLKSMRDASPFTPVASVHDAVETGARGSFDAALAFLDTVRAPGDAPATFLLDEFLELRTFESFPGLRQVLHEFVDGIAASGNRFVLSSRHAARTLRLIREHTAAIDLLRGADVVVLAVPLLVETGGAYDVAAVVVRATRARAVSISASTTNSCDCSPPAPSAGSWVVRCPTTKRSKRRW